MGILNFFKNAFSDMKDNARAQHEVDKAEFEAVKAEAKANFEANRGYNTFRRAKADAKKHWDDAHMSPRERAKLEKELCNARVEDGNRRIEEANAIYDSYKKRK